MKPTALRAAGIAILFAGIGVGYFAKGPAEPKAQITISHTQLLEPPPAGRKTISRSPPGLHASEKIAARSTEKS